MADNKKYYYLKLKDNFFDSDEMIVLESMPDGYIYSNILLKLYLRSLKYQGRLMFNDRIPFNSDMLSKVTRHSVGDVEKAISIFKELGLVEIMDNGAIYMSDIQSFIGKSSTEADRKRDYRQQIEQEKNNLLPQGQMSDKCPDKTTPEKDIDIDIDIDKEKEIENKSLKDQPKTKKQTKPIRHQYGEYKNVLLSDEEFETLKQEFSTDWENRIERVSEYCASQGKSYKNYLATIRNWAKRDKKPQQSGYKQQSIRQEILPDWVNNPPEEKKLSKEKKAELDKQIADFLARK